MENILNWYNHKCEEANFNRLGVMAFILLVQTCIIIPATLLAISVGGSSLLEVTLIAVFSFSVLASLLGDLSSKKVIPLFIISTVVHLLVILINVI
jgi:lipopolysaccharide export LptBFGC system permease protein LptF